MVDKFNLLCYYKFIKNGHEEYLLEYQTTNIWETELNSLIDCLNEMFDLSNKDESFTLDEAAINEVLTTIFTRLNEPTKTNAEKTLLKMCYDSEIVLNKLTLEIDNVLLNQNMITADEANKVKDSNGYYTYQELQAFTNSIEVFDIGDVLNSNPDDLTSKITDSIFKLNEYREEEKFSGLRTIDVIYDSYLVMYIFSDKLDTSIVDLIKDSVLSQIKDNKKVYPKDELVSLVDAINELEITSLDNLSNFDFNNISSFNNTSITDNSKTKLNVIYKSLLVGGIMTKTINDITLKPDAFLVDHPLAYQTDIEIYKENEISSLIEILDGVNVESFELADVNLSLVKDAIYYEPTNATSSYILVATISKELSAHNGVVIPLRTIDENVTTSNVIKPLELHKLLTSCELLMGNDDLSTWSIDTSAISLPAAAVREQVSESEIVRASITEMIAATNQDDEDLEVWVNKEHCEMVKDVNNNDIVVVDKEELLTFDLVYKENDKNQKIDLNLKYQEADESFTIKLSTDSTEESEKKASSKVSVFVSVTTEGETVELGADVEFNVEIGGKVNGIDTNGAVNYEDLTETDFEEMENNLIKALEGTALYDLLVVSNEPDYEYDYEYDYSEDI